MELSVRRGFAASAMATLAFTLPLLGLSGLTTPISILASMGALSIAVASARGDMDRLSVVGWLPMSAVFLIALVSVLAVTAGVLNAPLWSERGSALIFWALLMSGTVAIAWLRGGRVKLWQGDRAAGVALLAAGGLGAFVVLWRPFEVWSRAVNGTTDFSRHLVIMKQVSETGFVDYPGLPRTVHALVGLLWQAAGGERYAVGWQALEGVAWLIVVLIISASVTVAVRCARLCGVQRRIGLAVLATLVTISMLLGGWVSAMFAGGYVTSLVSGLTLIALLSVVFDGDWSIAPHGALAAAGSLVVLANNWPLLIGIAGPVLLLSIVLLWRSRNLTWGVMLGVVVLGITAAVPLWHLVEGYGFVLTGSGSEVGAGAANLSGSVGREEGPRSFWIPQWWWSLLIAGAVLAMFRGLLSSRRTTGLLMSTVLFSGLLTALLVWVVGGARWPDMGYYPFKALWTVLVLLLPIGMAGLVWSVTWLVRTARESRPGLLRIGLISGLAAVSVLGVAVFLGRLTANTPLLWVQATQGLGTVVIQIPVVTAVEETLADAESQSLVEREGLPWGISPYADIDTITGAGYLDLLSSEALEWTGLKPWPGLRINLLARDARDVCSAMAERADVVRVTGPSTASGLDWLRESGCPENIVQSESWITVLVEDSWFEGLPFYEQPYSYPTWQQYQESRDGAPSG